MNKKENDSMKDLAFIHYVLLETNQIELYQGTKFHFILMDKQTYFLPLNTHGIVLYYIASKKINVLVFLFNVCLDDYVR